MSKTVHLEEVPYSPDSCALFERLADLPGAAFLDSGFPHAPSGRYDILTADPASDGLPTLEPLAGESAARRFFEELGRYHREQYAGIQPVSPDIPFCGGMLGYLSYECGYGLNKVDPPRADRDPPGPCRLNAYHWCVIQDHLLGRAVLASLPQLKTPRRADLMARLKGPARRCGARFTLDAPFRSNLDQSAYRGAFERIQAYIRAGDCYQVNLAQRFSARCSGDPWNAYRELRAIAAAPFSAYLAGAGDHAVMCLSPERFISLHGHRVETSPIKGTRPRHRDPRADASAARALRSSEKERAENLMIVDLLRNDLGRCCIPGSIHVDRLFEIQSYPTVHHMVSTISGELRSGCDAFDLLRETFPGGSVTGAPKRRAMEIIAELEPDGRQVYCGSILYVSADGRMDSNIAIRSLQCGDGRIHCWGGGGIVADSRWEREYQETYDKVGRFIGALEARSTA
jgi:para-aminobenzoate synthetase component 1